MKQNSINQLQISKEHFRIASRFMKEVGLYYYWMQYLNDPKTTKDWDINDRHYTIIDIFGKTRFTDYLKEKGKPLPHGLFLYELFARYVWNMYPMLRDEVSDEACSSYYLTVDKEKKKVTINY